jgi:predicted  nucleic acid-binding Zn ribbon protein
MHVAEISFPFANNIEIDVVSDLVNRLLAVWRMNGQVCNREWPITVAENVAFATVLIPEPISLEKEISNEYVKRAITELLEKGYGLPEVKLKGEDIDSNEACSCTKVNSYILYTTYISLESPLRCGDCFCPIPLYKIPPTDGQEFYNLICWQSDYSSCDSLQMNCGTLERAATREMSCHNSRLSKQGLEVCQIITASTNIPSYYYLYRNNGRSKKQEQQRKCPSCGGEWLLDEQLHCFDFKCDKCRLLSNIAWNVR